MSTRNHAHNEPDEKSPTGPPSAVDALSTPLPAREPRSRRGSAWIGTLIARMRGNKQS
jgi:hypothetical protein